MNELKKLTWKYFWQQKFKEIMMPITLALALMFMPYLIGQVIPDNILNYLIEFGWAEIPIELTFSYYWGAGFLLLIPIVLIGGLSYGVITEIIKWLKSNWRKAEMRAKTELVYDSIKEGEELANLNQGSLL